jgi:hypothetical protein
VTGGGVGLQTRGFESARFVKVEPKQMLQGIGRQGFPWVLSVKLLEIMSGTPS